MKRIVITGAHGLLGEACCRLLKADYAVLPFTRSVVDLSDLQKLSDVLSGIEFDFLINTAAMSGLEQCLDQPESAEKVNADAPRLMAEICQNIGAKMLQISTDYVLDGRENRMHDESSPTRGSGVYSQTKLAAEQSVMQACENSIIGRVSWLFGYGRETFVDQVVNNALRGERVSYIGDKFSVPNFSDDLVPAMCALLESDLTGIVHLTNDAEPESWYSYAGKVLNTARSLGIVNNDMSVIDESKLDDISFFRQERPRYTAMKPRRLSEEFNIKVRNWEDGMRDYLLWKAGNSLTNK